jgi:hypothetical protein
MSKKQKIIFSICLAVFFSASALGILAFLFKNKLVKQQINSEYKTGWQEVIKGDAKKGVLDYQQALKKSRDAKIEVKPRRNMELAIAQIKNDQTEDGLKLLKEVFLDKRSSNKDKARIMNKLAELSLVVPNIVLEKNLFNDSKLAGFYVSDYPFRTKENLLSQANSYYGTASNFFQLAYNNADKYIDSFREDSPLKEKRDIYKKQMIKMLGKGEAIFSKVNKEDSVTDRVLTSYLYRAKAYSLIENIDDPDLNAIKKSEYEIKSSFQKAIELSSNPYNRQGPENWLQFSYLYYAEHLNKNEQGNKDQINQILERIVNNSDRTNSQGLNAFLRKEVYYNMAVSHRQEIFRLVGINKKWDNYLKSMGWKID